ncbi:MULTISPECIES: exodeoxyribonuclease VII small subunit [Nocardiopsis]|uniref:exodeoxyribonuclease VII small subunit n=1 Tax=Nocardiopsis TaxID=2013 RepID=UPI0003474A5B|nr:MULTISPECIES: exodeoxyribonuclease VII small subunit [Nocardiopsis]
MPKKSTAEAEAPEKPDEKTTGEEPELSYEEAREELDSVVRRLESGGLTLKESLALWERGEQLAKTCEQWLEGARAKLAVAMEENTPENGAENEGDAPF